MPKTKRKLQTGPGMVKKQIKKTSKKRTQKKPKKAPKKNKN